MEVTDLLGSLPQVVPYDTLRQTVIMRTGKSDENKFKDLFNNVEQDVKTLSQLLRRMRSLLGPNMFDIILRCMSMDKLPTTTTQVLAHMTADEELKKLLMLPIVYMRQRITF